MIAILEDHVALLAERAGATAETADIVTALVLESIKVGPDGAVKIIDSAGNTRIGGAAGGYSDMTPAELVAEIAVKQPILFRRPEPDPVPEAKPQAETAERSLTLEVLRQARVEKAAAAAMKATAETANPYRRATWNLTVQAALEATNPERADALKAEAAAIPPHLDRKF